MKNTTNLNFLTFSASLGARCKSYVVALLLLTSIASAQNGNYILNYSQEGSATITNNNINTFKVTPFLGHYNYKQQYIYYPAEFATPVNGLGIGLGAKEIKSLAFNVTSLPYAPEYKTFANVRIRMGNYTASTFANTSSAPFGKQFTSTDPLDKVTGTPFTMEVPDFQITELGWKTFDLVDDVTGGGFIWDGASPILVEISNDTPVGTNITQASDAWSWHQNSYQVEGTTYASSTISRTVGGHSLIARNTAFGTLGRDMWGGTTINSGTMNETDNGKINTISNRKFRPNIRFEMACHYWNEGGVTSLLSTVLPNDEGCKKWLLHVTGASRGHGLVYLWQRSTTPGFGDGDVIEDLPNSDTESYVATQANVDYYYRRLTDCGGAIMPSAPIFFGKANVNTFNGSSWSAGSAPDEFSDARVVFAGGNYTINANAKGCGCTINAGANVEVASGKTLRIDDDLRIDGSLTLHSGAALLQGNPQATTTGVVTVRKSTQPMVMYDFTYYGSPVEGVVLNQFSPATLSDKFYKWDVTPATSAWAIVPPTNVMERAQGYIIRAPQGWSTTTPTVFTGVFTGKPHNGTFTGTIKTGSTNMNMVVNPYPSPLDLKKFHAANSTKLDGTYYFWTHNTPITGMQYSANDFAMFNATGGTGTKATNAGGNTTVPNGKVEVGQGFMVKGRDAATGLSTVTYTNEMRLPASADAQFFRTAANVVADATAEIDSRFWLNFSGSSSFKQILVGYVNGATEAYDNGYDGEISADAATSFYSILNDYKLGIQGKGAFNAGDAVAIGFHVNSAGTYKIALDNFDGVFTSRDIFLKDKLTNVTHNLKNGAYEFITVPGTHNERFEITYINLSPALGVVNNGVSDVSSMFVAFKQNNDLVVNAGSAEIDMVQVFDLSGRMLLQQKGSSANNVIVSHPNWASQVLIVQMHTADKLVLTKKVVF